MSAPVIGLCKHCKKPFQKVSHYNKHIESEICLTDSSSSSRPPVSAKSSSSKLEKPSKEPSKEPSSSKEPGPVKSFWEQLEKEKRHELIVLAKPTLLPKLHKGTGHPSSAKPHNSLPKTPHKIEQALQTLGLDKSTINSKILDKAWRELAIEFHPDKHPGDEVKEEEFKKKNEAHKQLLKWLEEEERRGGGSTRRNRQKYFKTKKTQTHRHTKHHRKTYRGRIYTRI
jgi:hypothetical protein